MFEQHHKGEGGNGDGEISLELFLTDARAQAATRNFPKKPVY